jgi:hypothetical protein
MEGFTSLAGYLLLGTLKDLEGKILSLLALKRWMAVSVSHLNIIFPLL